MFGFWRGVVARHFTELPELQPVVLQLVFRLQQLNVFFQVSSRAVVRRRVHMH